MATGIARSGVKRIRLHDLRHSHASNNTEYNYTEFNENESYQYLSEQEKGKDRIKRKINRNLRVPYQRSTRICKSDNYKAYGKSVFGMEVKSG